MSKEIYQDIQNCPLFLIFGRNETLPSVFCDRLALFTLPTFQEYMRKSLIWDDVRFDYFKGSVKFRNWDDININRCFDFDNSKDIVAFIANVFSSKAPPQRSGSEPESQLVSAIIPSNWQRRGTSAIILPIFRPHRQPGTVSTTSSSRCSKKFRRRCRRSTGSNFWSSLRTPPTSPEIRGAFRGTCGEAASPTRYRSADFRQLSMSRRFGDGCPILAVSRSRIVRHGWKGWRARGTTMFNLRKA